TTRTGFPSLSLHDALPILQHRPETGEPVALGPAIGDLVPSLHAVSGILMALLRRGLTNEGSYVDIAMFDSCASINELAIATTLRSEEHTSELQSRENLVCR